MVNITFPDGSVRSYEQGVTGLQIAESISPALARSVVSCAVNGETVELNRPINEDATIALFKFDDDEGKHTFWHTSAHLLAEALQELYPGVQFGFGPAVDNGFFYDVLLPGGEMVSLIKPQFEAGRGQAPGGVVTDPSVRARVVADISAFGTKTLGLDLLGVAESPIRGRDKGNVEYLAWWRKRR